jgi:hypothetical protein
MTLSHSHTHGDHTHGDHMHGDADRHDHPHPHDHNSTADAAPGHLHSHPHGRHDAEEEDAIALLVDAFVEGYAGAADKIGFLRLAGVPFELDDAAGGPSLKLIEVQKLDCHQVGTASPGFASRELVYHPYTGALVRERTQLSFVYVSLETTLIVPLRDHIAARARAHTA